MAFFSPAQPREDSHHIPSEESFLFLDKIADKLLKWSLQVPAEPESVPGDWGCIYLLGESALSPTSSPDEGRRRV